MRSVVHNAKFSIFADLHLVCKEVARHAKVLRSWETFRAEKSESLLLHKLREVKLTTVVKSHPTQSRGDVGT